MQTKVDSGINTIVVPAEHLPILSVEMIQNKLLPR